MPLRYYGIRHHGPGCARALRAALDAQQPDIVLLEGPPEADEIVSLAADAAMIPPVALLVYPVDAARLGAFYPFAEFSPEWQAIRHAGARAVPLRFIDLPLSHGFAETLARKAEAQTQVDNEEPGEDDKADSLDAWRIDPVGELSHAGGYEDRELWWDVQIEQRRDAHELFEAIAEAMTALREAHMRLRIRDAQKAGFTNIAVVCGAWHVPALKQTASVKDDQALLKGLPKTRVEATWLPWSDERLASSSGYGAGVTSPGWYRHVWESADRTGLRWATEAARLLREEGLDASTASVIETTRLADTLAAMRGLSLPGLVEMREALLTVLCHGHAEPLELIRRKLEVGERIGAVPATAAAAPLLRDLETQQKRLRLKSSTEIKTIDLDLREDGGRDRSVLLHRLSLLDVAWGMLLRDSNRTGTFRESWQLRWNPEMVVALLAASRQGNTIEDAAACVLAERARKGASLPELTAMLDQAVLASLPASVHVLLKSVRTEAALSADVMHLMAAAPPLARVARYGNVRGTDSAALWPIIESLVERAMVGIAAAASHVDEALADQFIEHIEALQVALDTLEAEKLREDWLTCLIAMVANEDVAPAVRGFSLRLAFDRQRVDADFVGRHASAALSAAVAPFAATAWLTGLLRGSGLLLLQHDDLWRVIDAWLNGLDHETFMERLPLLRRAFAQFQPAERREMGNKVKSLDGRQRAASSTADVEVELDHRRAALVLPVLSAIHGNQNTRA
jgi:hypothetical protein